MSKQLISSMCLWLQKTDEMTSLKQAINHVATAAINSLLHLVAVQDHSSANLSTPK